MRGSGEGRARRLHLSLHDLDGDQPEPRAVFGLRAKPWTADEFEKLNREVGPQWVAIARELGVTLD